MLNPPTRYLGQAAIARKLGVSRHLIIVWRGRYPDFPEPDAWTGGDEDEGIPGWLPERMPEIRAWEKSRPGQGRRTPQP